MAEGKHDVEGQNLQSLDKKEGQNHTFFSESDYSMASEAVFICFLTLLGTRIDLLCRAP